MILKPLLRVNKFKKRTAEPQNIEFRILKVGFAALYLYD